MKFSEFSYQRPDIKRFSFEVNGLLKKFEEALNVKAQIKIIDEINRLRNDIESMAQIVSIRHTINTLDKFYEQEQNFMDENRPYIEEVTFKFYTAIINSKFKDELKEIIGEHIFTLSELTVKSFSPIIIEDLKEENKLSSEYTKLIASAKINFEGEERNLSQLVPFMTSKDRDVRKRAYEARFNFFLENEDKLDELYDRLVKVRDRIARKLGYKNFVELGYIRMTRSDYDSKMVKNFRDNVLKYIVPLSIKLKERQRVRLGLDKLMYYDDKFTFNSGNPTPKGSSEYIVNMAKKMYAELSPETDEFFKFMTETKLMDLESKKGKAGGGYCTLIKKYNAPFIFANFNGTEHDVTVLTHEGGHAFQGYESMGFNIPEYNFPTYEACEIHSMSMEFFTFPWMEYFFKEDTEKYLYSHVEDSLLFIPYGVSVDEFQHFVYENPNATPAERKSKWREIEKKYTPWKDYEGCDYLERGGLWMQQLHIFIHPFYYIDYTLAQMCAYQFFIKSIKNHKEAWSDYLTLCKAGGSKSFLNLVKLANLISPFEEEAIKSVIGEIESYLSNIDDRKF